MLGIEIEGKKMKKLLGIGFLLVNTIILAVEEPLAAPLIAKERYRPSAYREYTPEQQAIRLEPIVIIPKVIEPNNRSIDENTRYIPIVSPRIRAKEIYTRPAMTR